MPILRTAGCSEAFAARHSPQPGYPMCSAGSCTPSPTPSPSLSGEPCWSRACPRHLHLQDANPGKGCSHGSHGALCPHCVTAAQVRSALSPAAGAPAGMPGAKGDPRPGLGPTTGTPGRGWGALPGACPTTRCCGTERSPPARPGAAPVRHRARPAPCSSPSSPAPGGAAASRPPPPAAGPALPGKGDDIIPVPPLAPPLPRPARHSGRDGGVPPAPPLRSRALGGPGGGSRLRRPASPLPHAPLRHPSHRPLSAGAGGGASPEGSAGAGQRLRGGFSLRRAPAHHGGAGAVRRARLRSAAGRARRAGGGAAPALTPAACARSCSGSGRLCLCAARPPRSGAVRGGGGAGATPAPPGASLLLPGTVCRRRVHGDLTERALPHR